MHCSHRSTATERATSGHRLDVAQCNQSAPAFTALRLSGLRNVRMCQGSKAGVKATALRAAALTPAPGDAQTRPSESNPQTKIHQFQVSMVTEHPTG